MLKERFLQSIVENLKSGVIIVDKNCRVLFINSEGKKILQLSNEKNQSITLNEIMIPVDEEYNPIMTSLFMRKSVNRRKFRIKDKEGKEILLGIGTVPLKNGDGSLLGVGAIFRDITHDELIEKEKERLKNLAIMGEMLSYLAHEFKNPMTSIQISISSLKERANLSDNDLKYLDVISESLSKINNSLKEIVQFSRPAQPDRIGMHPVFQPLYRAVSLMNPQLKKKNIQTNIDFASTRNVKALFNPGLLEQVFINLIVNAIEAMPDGGSLTVGIEQTIASLDNKTPKKFQPKYVDIKFQDTGIGILPEHLDHIFEPFFTAKRNGTGLGLAIVRKVIEEAGGEIFVESKPGEGSCFTIRLLSAKSKDRSDE